MMKATSDIHRPNHRYGKSDICLPLQYLINVAKETASEAWKIVPKFILCLICQNTHPFQSLFYILCIMTALPNLPVAKTDSVIVNPFSISWQ
jgi:hypothetical protein